MKKLAIIGATGYVGTPLVKEALNRGYEVTAIARNTDKLTPQKGLTIKKADVYKTDEFVNAIKGNDAAVSAYNPGWTDPNIYNDFLEGSQVIQKGVKQAGVKRFIYVGGAGSLQLEPGQQLVDSDTFPADYKQGAMGLRDYLKILKKEDELEWTYLSPAINLIPGPRKGNYRIGNDEPVFDTKGESNISVEDLAIAVMDELENNKFIRKRFTVGY